MVDIAVAGFWRKFCNLWIILGWSSVAIPSCSRSSHVSSPDSEEALGSVSCNAHHQRSILRGGETQICNDNDDTKKGEDGTDDIHADAGVHLKDIKGGEQ